ncbi:MAG TPA: YhjD/YihY/BrkB family envelope integrity protein [Trebonia sp.]
MSTSSSSAGRPRGTARPLAAAADRARQFARTYAPRLSGLIGQLAHVRLVETATVLAAQAFLTAGPVLLAVAALSPDPVQVWLRTSLRAFFGLRGAALEEAQQIFGSYDDETRAAYGAIGIIIMLASATGLSRALQQTCERSWDLPHAKARVVAWRWLPCLFVMLAVLLAEATAQNGLGVGPAVAVPLSMAISTPMWWWTQHLLLGGRIAWPPLLPGAVLAAVGTAFLFWASQAYMPGALNRAIAQSGPLGSVFTILTWLIVFWGLVTAGLAVGYTVARARPFARWLRTPPAPR